MCRNILGGELTVGQEGADSPLPSLSVSGAAASCGQGAVRQPDRLGPGRVAQEQLALCVRPGPVAMGWRPHGLQVPTGGLFDTGQPVTAADIPHGRDSIMGSCGLGQFVLRPCQDVDPKLPPKGTLATSKVLPNLQNGTLEHLSKDPLAVFISEMVSRSSSRTCNNSKIIVLL